MEQKSKKILLVDDDPGMRALLSVLLKSEGFQVIVAADGQEGLTKARTEKPDLILLDVTLPKLDGYHVARMLKYDVNYQHIPIILQTAKGYDNELEIGKEVGADAYFTKPYDANLLMDKIKEILASKTSDLEV